ncbi:chloride channel protein [Ferruginibacter lapsinanis]|uniref:chloride channel protein n=1 Tax=Ferruginibacter lapsinanis TaxID=563172 RepID=UPI001E3C98C1|nr:chloride channel protein [Ferruginibacter lapsinanis]UEG49937.1 chloride channel protein [Ferruginibacter lapsinanis]
MSKHSMRDTPIPVSISLTETLEAENIYPRQIRDKKRIITIALLAIGIAVLTSLLAKVLVSLINLVTNISFHGNFSITHVSPLGNTLGVWVIVIPVIGGIIVGLMALYGSKAIRGHGIPEAMEQILTNQSKIKPTITYLKPISAAIAIGTGGPFGAEGPIIATGGALGSTIGQLLKITHNERKILLAAGATAGMSAIFGSPVAAVFLAIELLLFEFSPRSIIPVALACITGAAGHYLLFEKGPVFPLIVTIQAASNTAIFSYSIIGITIGLLAVGVTKSVYFIEDLFEKIPIHWMWWPAIGGIAVGTVGYFNPHTLGVGYENITNIISGTLPVQIVLSLCILKFISWAIALGSGTSGGTLAPLLTIGAATGLLVGALILHFFPSSGISISLAALVGMAAMFAGASRALLTSIIFALETTGQTNALLPLLAACTAAYFVSFFLMKNTIMTEKIGRRGVSTPDSYEPDILERKTVADVLNENATLLSEENTIEEIRTWLKTEETINNNYFIVISAENTFKGIISTSDLLSTGHIPADPIGSLIKQKHTAIYLDSSLRAAVEKMAEENIDVLPVVATSNDIIGVVSYKDIITAYKHGKDEHEKKSPHISLRNYGLTVLVHGKRLIKAVTRKNNNQVYNRFEEKN